MLCYVLNCRLRDISKFFYKTSDSFIQDARHVEISGMSFLHDYHPV